MSLDQTPQPTPTAGHRIRQQIGVREWLGLGFVLAAASMVTVQVPLGLSRSGSLALTLGDFVGSALWAALAAGLVMRRWTLRGNYRTLAIAVAVFLGWMAVVTVLRQRAGDEVLQAFLVMRTTVVPLAAYFMFGAGWEKPWRALHGLVVLEVGLNLWHLGDWNNTRWSPFLGNSIIYTGLLVMLLPVNAWVLARATAATPLLLRLAAFLNIVAAFVFPPWAGSRVMTVVLAVTALGTLLVLVMARRGLRRLLAAAIVALVVSGTVWLVNPAASAYGLYRLVPPPADFGITFFDDIAVDESAQRDTLVEEMRTSDVGRGDLIDMSMDSFQRNPWIGEGHVYFPLETSEGPMEYAAHNFVLEHLNAYGAIGFVLYAGLFLVMLLPGLLRLLPRQEGSTANQVALLVTASALAFSLVQPTMLIMSVVMPLIVVIGALKAEIIRTTEDHP
jgi:hypothetical protein